MSVGYDELKNWIVLEKYQPCKWFKIGEPTNIEGDEEGKPFAGIGPDGFPITRGITMPWPFEKDGSISPTYLQLVNYIQAVSARKKAKEEYTRKTLSDWMDDIMNDRIPFPTLDEFLARFTSKEYSSDVIKEFARNIGKLLVEEIKRMDQQNKKT